MAAELLRIDAIAKLDPDPERELVGWRDDLVRGVIDDPDETRTRLDGLDRGDWAVVRLHLFADLLEGDSVKRRDGAIVPGCWFERGAADQNVNHARELTRENLELLRDNLSEQGIGLGVGDLDAVPVRIELDPELDRATS